MEQLIPWKHSIASLEDSSDGQSLIDYTRKWGQKQFAKTDTEYDLSLEFSTGTSSRITLTISGAPDEVTARLIGCFAVSVIPDIGLPETLQCLKRIFEFYSEQQTHSKNKFLPLKLIKTTVTGRDKRPDLVLTE